MNPSPSPHCRGIALVLTLAMLVLISGLIVAFLSSVRTDLSSSQGYASGVDVRMLADSTLNVVIGQIQEASQRPGEAWVSQPGLIRTYDTGGNPVKAYKLYSSADLVVDGEFNPLDAAGEPADVPTDWRDQGTDVYVDLNEPVLGGGSPVYPILDPRALSLVDGFEATTEELKDAKGVQVLYEDGTNAKAIPMPVRWLYVLKDGSRAVAEPTGTPGVSTIAGSGPDNPPIARLAFWTDDESAKININTASEGTYYDAPVANTYKGGLGLQEKVPMPSTYTPDPEQAMFDLDLAWFQPARLEYQRYPGHPATTSLSPVFYDFIEQGLGGSAARKDVLEEIYKISPRYAGGSGSSLAGTVRPATGSALALSDDRLYATLDELLFSNVFNGATGTRGENTIDAAGKRRELLSIARFFTTARSNAPEQTLFNSPRVAIWPVDSDPARRTAFDKLVAFCATLKKPGDPSGSVPYYLMRKNPLSMTEDWNLTIGGQPTNQNLYTYLQDLTSRAIPGFTTTPFSAPTKWGVDERNQILMEILDYVRATNLIDKTNGTPYTAGTIPTNSNFGVVLPLEPPPGTPGAGTKGFGRYFSLSELALMAVVKKPAGDPNVLPLTNSRRVQFALLPEFYSPSVGHPALAYAFRMEFTGLDSLKLGGQSLFQNAAHTIRSPHALVSGYGDSSLSFNGGPMGFYWYAKEEKVSYPVRAPDEIYPLGELVLDKDYTGSVSGNVKIELWYDPPTGAAPVLVQQGEFDFGNVAFQMPTWVPSGKMKAAGGTGTFLYPADHDWSGLANNRIKYSLAFIRNGDGTPYVPIDDNGNAQPKTEDKYTDWLVSLVPDMASIDSDYRLINAVPSSEDLGVHFKQHPWTGGDRFAHSLHGGWVSGSGKPDSYYHAGSKTGKLTEGIVAQLRYEAPDVAQPFPATADTGVKNYLDKTGDWSTAVGQFPDGPLIDRADEGEAPFGDSKIPYFGHHYSNKDDFVTSEQAETYFSPNRLVPSPVILGSLPTGVKRGRPWQTLLFRPDKPYFPGQGQHPGNLAGGPPDHLLLDLFWMPVVEPYAISEPFSTAGKINLNYQIAPFTNIKRSTGMRGVLHAVMITALPPFAAVDSKKFHELYKAPLYASGAKRGEDILARHPIDADATLSLFEERFAANKPFVSASEVTTMPIVPASLGLGANSTPAQIDTALASFWQDKVELTGDNAIERPYAMIYPRVTTKSNTYQVHVRAQSLKVTPASADAGEFRQGIDQITGEFRGSFVIERFLDANLQTYDPANPAGLGPYKMRVVSSKQVSR